MLRKRQSFFTQEITLEDFERKKQTYLKKTVELQLKRDLAYFEKIKQIDRSIFDSSKGQGSLESQRIHRMFKDILLQERDRLAKEWLEALADDRILEQIRKTLD